MLVKVSHVPSHPFNAHSNSIYRQGTLDIPSLINVTGESSSPARKTPKFRLRSHPPLPKRKKIHLPPKTMTIMKAQTPSNAPLSTSTPSPGTHSNTTRPKKRTSTGSTYSQTTTSNSSRLSIYSKHCHISCI